jgi:hypothetical protein
VSTFHSVEALAAHVAALPAPPRARLVGITGPPGVGKSTVAASLVALLGAAALLPMDGYHYSQARLVSLGRRERMGAPDTFDVEGFLATLRELRAGRATVFAPGFDREIEEAVPAAISTTASVSRDSSSDTCGSARVKRMPAPGPSAPTSPTRASSPRPARARSTTSRSSRVCRPLIS